MWEGHILLSMIKSNVVGGSLGLRTDDKGREIARPKETKHDRTVPWTALWIRGRASVFSLLV